MENMTNTAAVEAATETIEKIVEAGQNVMIDLPADGSINVSTMPSTPEAPFTKGDVAVATFAVFGLAALCAGVGYGIYKVVNKLTKKKTVNVEDSDVDDFEDTEE